MFMIIIQQDFIDIMKEIDLEKPLICKSITLLQVQYLEKIIFEIY